MINTHSFQHNGSRMNFTQVHGGKRHKHLAWHSYQ